MKTKLILVGVIMLAAGGNVAAQSAAPIFRGEVTESALVDALTPEPRTRSIRPGASPPKPAAASLLITFKTNSADLTSQAKSQLDVVARALKNDQLSEFRFRIEGHADPRGTAEHNLILSRKAGAIGSGSTARTLPLRRIGALLSSTLATSSSQSVL